MAMRSFLLTLLLLLTLVPTTLAQRSSSDRLVGTWVGSSSAIQGKVYVLAKDGSADLDGNAARWSADEDQLSLTAGGETMRVPYRIVVNSLTLTIDGERLRYRRQKEAKPAKEPEGHPLGGATPMGNPLAGAVGDPFARAFRGAEVSLVLRADGRVGYSGELAFQGMDYPARAQRGGAGIEGSFEAGGNAFPFTARLEGNGMTLESGGKSYRLEAEGGSPGAAPVEGVDSGPGTDWKHPRGWYSFTMPSGWTVAQESDEGLLLNPGFGAQDTLDAILLISHGELEEDERGIPVETLTTRYEGEVRNLMAQQGVQLEPAKNAPRRVQVGELPGCEQTWKGTAGGQQVTLWLGLVAKREYYMVTLGLLVDGKGERYLPGLKRVLTTLEPTPPERNRQLESGFVGRSISNSSYTDSGSFHTKYELGGGGSVMKENFFSSAEVSSSTEDSGRYEVIGDQLYLFFSDGQECGQVEMSGGGISGVRFGESLYSFH